MSRQWFAKGLFAALCVPVMVLTPAVANAAVHEINIGGVGYVYDAEYAGMILKDSPFRTPGAAQYYINKEAEYPNTGTDASTEMGATATLALIHKICSEDPNCQIEAFGGSNGSNVLSRVNDIMIETNDPLIERLSLYLTVNPRDPNGGIATSFPTGSTVPFTEITAGSPTQSGGAYIVSFRNRYDPISDFPAHPFNLLADINSFIAFFTVHPLVNPNVDDPRNVVTVSEDGKFVSVLVHTEVLPILQPLALFLPKPILQPLDAVLRPIIDSAYARPAATISTIPMRTETSDDITDVPEQRTIAVDQPDENPLPQSKRMAALSAQPTATVVDKTGHGDAGEEFKGDDLDRNDSVKKDPTDEPKDELKSDDKDDDSESNRPKSSVRSIDESDSDSKDDDDKKSSSPASLGSSPVKKDDNKSDKVGVSASLSGLDSDSGSDE